MQATPLFLGACALASVAGVVSGTTIDTRLIQRAGIGMDKIHRPGIAFGTGTALSDQVALPDHYALDTPEGRFEVGELSTRGVYAQRRFGWRHAQWTPPPEHFLEEPAAEPNWSASAADLAALEDAEARELAASNTSAGPATPPVPSEPSADEGQARTINVEDALALQSG